MIILSNEFLIVSFSCWYVFFVGFIMLYGMLALFVVLFVVLLFSLSFVVLVSVVLVVVLVSVVLVFFVLLVCALLSLLCCLLIYVYWSDDLADQVSVRRSSKCDNLEDQGNV